jgi:3-oxoacyl-[acyl-carrier-protein] synthase-1
MSAAPVPITAFGIASALGVGQAPTLAALRQGRSGLARRRFETCTLDTWIGRVDAVDDVRLPLALAEWDCRNNRLAELALASDDFAHHVRRAAQRVGAARVGVFLGTSTSGILSTEIAYRERDAATGALPAWLNFATTHDNAALARYVRTALGLAGPAWVISTACSSGAKAYASAARLISFGVIDAAVVGGVDSLCLTTLYGFNALQLLSPDICRPWDAHRNGLSIGEGASFALLQRDATEPVGWLLGCGESSDGHHMSAPHPEGAGAALAMRGALAQAGLDAGAIDYVNLHGTATPNNDAAEDLAVCAVFGREVPVSSTKGATGHTLGAAGAIESAITLLALQEGLVPAGLNVREPDPGLHANYQQQPLRRPLRAAANNSFGFGGSNACLVFGAAR